MQMIVVTIGAILTAITQYHCHATLYPWTRRLVVVWTVAEMAVKSFASVCAVTWIEYTIEILVVVVLERKLPAENVYLL